MAARIRRVPCIVRPLSPARTRAYEAQLGPIEALPSGLVAVQTPALLTAGALASTEPSRRGFMRTAGLGTAALAMGVSGAGCSEESVALLMRAIEVAKEVFAIAEQILGAFVMNNQGGTSARFEVIASILGGVGYTDEADAISCIGELPANSGLMEVAWCVGMNAQAPGQHIARGIEGGHGPVDSDPFQVMGA